MADVWTAIETDTLGEPLPLAQDQEKVWVYCSREVWRNHILTHHPEIEALKDLILSAIANSQTQDVDPEDHRVIRYYIEVPSDRFESRHSLLLRVVVKYVPPLENDRQRVGLLSSVYLLRKE